MSYHNLTNEEIVFMYHVAVSVTKQYENAYTDESIIQSLPVDEQTVIEVTTALPKDLVDDMLKSKHYTLMKEIVVKLKPIIELIKDVEPEIYEQISELFTFK
jgi:hypothetical protein